MLMKFLILENSHGYKIQTYNTNLYDVGHYTSWTNCEIFFISFSRVSRYSHHSRPTSAYSYRSGRPMAPSEVSTVKTKVTRRPGMTIETMSAPNPFCPNTKGICCLMLLLNLGLILVTLGFVIVIQFFEPLYVW